MYVSQVSGTIPEVEQSCFLYPERMRDLKRCVRFCTCDSQKISAAFRQEIKVICFSVASIWNREAPFHVINFDVEKMEKGFFLLTSGATAIIVVNVQCLRRLG